VSTVHANFIIQSTAGTPAPRKSSPSSAGFGSVVRAARGIVLEPEVLLYGRKWEDVL